MTPFEKDLFEKIIKPAVSENMEGITLRFDVMLKAIKDLYFKDLPFYPRRDREWEWQKLLAKIKFY